MTMLASLLLAPDAGGPGQSDAAFPFPRSRTPSASVTRDGVTLPTQIDVDGQALVLNGTATRKKFIVKVYVAALYLPARETDAETILDADEPRQLVIQFVHDGVDKGDLCDALTAGAKEGHARSLGRAPGAIRHALLVHGGRQEGRPARAHLLAGAGDAG